MNAAAALPRPLTILVCALGGEGGGVLSEWLVEAARRAGFPVQSTSIPGVAQRTGATTYYLEVVPVAGAALGGRTPVLSLYPVPGALDLLVSSELLETARQVAAGMVSGDRTRVVTSSSRTLTTNERMQLGDGRREAAALLDAIRRHSREHVVFDMAQAAQETGSVVSAVMFGAIAASGVLPLERADCEAVIRAGGKGVEASLRGFDKAFGIVDRARRQVGFVEGALRGGSASEKAAPSSPADPRCTDADGSRRVDARPAPAAARGPVTEAKAAGALPAAARARLPEAVHAVVALGHARVAEYQDRAYAGLYLERVERVLAAERAADPDGAQAWQTTLEAARFLALWMAFDDIVRVADLKCRAARRARIGREVKLAEGEVLRVWDHFKPGVPEFAALLPAAAARALTRWDRRRQARGRAPFAMALKVGTHSVSGLLMLRALAALRRLRPHGSRYAEEQALIERWLSAIVEGSRADWAVGHEIALCGRLIKGYGSTNERGRANLLHIVDHVVRVGATGPAALPGRHPDPVQPQARAAAIRAARTAALADEAGTALDRVLAEHGAAPRPLAEAPIRFVRKPHGVRVPGRGEERVTP
jgi:indolepyruvate ferredoxin oxidoreductase beta subunit